MYRHVRLLHTINIFIIVTVKKKLFFTWKLNEKLLIKQELNISYIYLTDNITIPTITNKPEEYNRKVQTTKSIPLYDRISGFIEPEYQAVSSSRLSTFRGTDAAVGREREREREREGGEGERERDSSLTSNIHSATILRMSGEMSLCTHSKYDRLGA